MHKQVATPTMPASLPHNLTLTEYIIIVAILLLLSKVYLYDTASLYSIVFLFLIFIWYNIVIGSGFERQNAKSSKKYRWTFTKNQYMNKNLYSVFVYFNISFVKILKNR